MYLQKLKHQALFFDQFAVLIKSGITVVETLGYLKNRTSLPSAITRELAPILKDVMTGMTLAKALKRHSFYLEPWQMSLIDISEKSGTLKDGLELISGIMATQAKQYTVLIKASMQPFFYLIILIIIAPYQQFMQMLIYKKPIPYLAQELKLIFFLSSVIILIIYLPEWIGSKKRRDSILLHIPIVGQAIKSKELHLFVHMLAICMGSGLNIVMAWNTAAEVSQNFHLRNLLSKGAYILESDGQIDLAFYSTTLFPEVMLDMIQVGEKTGTIKAQLEKCAVMLESDYHSAIEQITVIAPKAFYIAIVIFLAIILTQIVEKFYLGPVTTGNNLF